MVTTSLGTSENVKKEFLMSSSSDPLTTSPGIFTEHAHIAWEQISVDNKMHEE
jgi:hypothetical protein